MKYLILVITLTFTWSAQAADWPSASAPCNTTLQACVDGTAENQTVFINSNSVIDETIVAFKNISLVAGNGYKPVFAAGRHVEISNTASSNRTLRIEGLTFTQGRIAYNHQSGSSEGGTLIIRNNHIMDNQFQNESVRILNFSNQTLILNVDYNQVNYTATTGSSNDRGAILVKTGFNASTPSSGVTTGRLYNNTIHTAGPDSIGIGLFSYNNNEVSLDIAGNEIWGGRTAAVFSFNTGGSGSVDLDIGNNAFYKNAANESFRGVFIQAFSGNTNVDIVNNSAIGAFDAFNFDESGTGSLDVYLYNNLMAFGSAAVFTDSQTTITNDYNLSYMNPFVDPDFTPGPNHVAANPNIVGLQNARLRPGSPAIEAANGLAVLAIGAVPFVDADGTSRIKKGDDSVGAQVIDIGAYETGDVYFNHRATNDTTHITSMDRDELNGNAALDDIHITSNWNPPGGLGVYNNDNEAIYYSSGLWRIFNEGFTDFNLNAAFNVIKYGNISSTLEHTATEGNNNTILDDISLNNQNDRILQVTQHWTGTYNPHPVGVLYFSGSWLITNMDLQNIPINSNFNVYSQPPSKSAWRHIATAANTSGQITYLDHPLLNNQPCAELQVTQSGGQGVFNDAPIGVYYELGRWTIFNQDLSDMLPNSEFHIMINPEQIAACSDVIFADDFE